MSRPDRSRTNRLWFVLGAAALAGVGLVIVIPRMRDAEWRKPRAFDAAVWRSESENTEGRSARHAMATELRVRLLDERPSRARVYELLGPPCFTANGNEWWTLGMSPGDGVTDDCGLQVEFGEDDHLATAVLVHQNE